MIPSDIINEAKKEIEENSFRIMIDNYIDNSEYFFKKNPFFYDRSGIWWFWNKNICCYEIKDDVDVMILIDCILGLEGQTVNSRIKSNYLEAFKRTGRINIPKEPPKKWIQFKNKAISIESGNMYDVTYHYFFTNPIPWDVGKTDKTPIMDKLFEEWVGKDFVQDLYEILAYSCYRDYPIQVMMCLYGCGRNGKSQYIKIINKFLGLKNICSTELDLLSGHNSSRFEIFKLYKKLTCMLGETNFGILSNTSLLKKLVGGDVIGYEKKGKDPFDDYNYAKIIIASNSLPSTEDTSDGFMRRWHIIDFPNEFEEGTDIIDTIPDEEYKNLALKLTKILPELLKKGSFKNQGTIEHRKTRYMMASNPLPIFIEKCCELSHDKHILYNKLYTEYVKYLISKKKRKVSSKEFKSSLDNEGFYLEKTSKSDGLGGFQNGTFVIGINLKKDTSIEKDIFCDGCDVCADICTRSPIEGGNSKTQHNCHNCHKSQNNITLFTKIDNQYTFFLNDISQNLGKNAIKIETFRKKCKNQYNDSNFESFLKKAKQEGEIFESPVGYIQLLI